MRSSLRLYSLRSLCLATFLLLASCTKSSSGGSDSSGAGGTPVAGEGQIATDCGVAIGSSLKNPIDIAGAELVTAVNVLGPNLVAVQDAAGGTRLIKLQGIGAELPSFKVGPAKDMIAGMLGQTFLFSPGKSCGVNVGGGQGTVAALFTENGVSFSEALLRANLASVDAGDPCGGSQLAGCYQALLNTASNNIGPAVGQFLWKPVSDSDGNLVVLVDQVGALITVNGENGTDIGPGNGYGTQTRFSKPGCSYGRATVQVIDPTNGVPYAVQGKSSISIQSPCARFEFGS